MKTPAYLIYTLRIAMLFAVILIVSSCGKTEKMQKFNDVFDTSGIEALNAKFVTAKTLNDLPVELGLGNFSIPEGIKNITPGEIAAWYKKNITLTDAEIDMLLKNDSKTYIDVINRIASLPPQIGSLKASDFSELRASNLDQYLLKQIDEPVNYYSTDYYSAILALQDYIKLAVIDPMEWIANPANQIPPGVEGQNPPVFLIGYKAIALNNIWDMWWAYWSDGTRVKHKGASGTFPG